MEPYITFSVESFQGQVRLQMKLGYSRPAFSYWVTAHGVKIDNSPSHVTSHTIVSTMLPSSSGNTYTLVIYQTGFTSVVIISHTSVIIIHQGHHHNSVTINNLPSHHCFKYFSHHQHHQAMQQRTTAQLQQCEIDNNSNGHYICHQFEDLSNHHRRYHYYEIRLTSFRILQSSSGRLSHACFNIFRRHSCNSSIF